MLSLFHCLRVHVAHEGRRDCRGSFQGETKCAVRFAKQVLALLAHRLVRGLGLSLMFAVARVMSWARAV